MNAIDQLFIDQKKAVLNVYCTAGYPTLESTIEVIHALQDNGADLIEIGMPYSDPLADGPVIQQSNMIALQNGMRIPVLLHQLKTNAAFIKVPIILMGYLNPVLQYGIEQFCKDASEAGVSGIILPDLPLFEFETIYQPIFKQYNLAFIFLITPETSEERIRKIDALSTGFVYAVSSSSTTGSDKISDPTNYFIKLQQLQLKNPILVGFGIKDKVGFEKASLYTHGAIIGSAYIKALANSSNITASTATFLNTILGKKES
ncbi:MAG: tryptophan synthase subunit alpha [Ferruginibacter sp.]